MMKLTSENYFSQEANKHYMSVSQFKELTPAFGGCEAKGMAKINGQYEQEPIMAFVEGHYVHAWQEGKLEAFKANNPDLYSTRGPTKGELKTNFKHCKKMIEVLENDPLVMKVLSGEKEVIMVAELFGIKWKIMIDSYNPLASIFADLKALKEMDGKFWNKEAQCYENFLEKYGYIVQMSVYSEIEKKTTGRKEWLIPTMVVVTKQNPPDHEIIYFDHEDIQQHLNIVENHIERVKQVKNGEVEPIRCESCDYCRLTKKIERIKHHKEFSIY